MRRVVPASADCVEPHELPHFSVALNELQTPKIVLCPSDGLGRVEAVNWSTNRTRGANAAQYFAGNSSVSYFVGFGR